MSEWFVKITGNKSDLEDLSHLFNTEELKIVEESDGYYLHSNKFDLYKEAREIKSFAVNLLETLTGVARLSIPELQPLKLGALAKENATGGRDLNIVVNETIHIRSRVSGDITVNHNGVEQKPKTPIAVVGFKVAQNDEQVDRAMRLWGKDPNHWNNHYKILEIIMSDTGNNIFNDGWANKKKVGLLKRTANNSEALGDDAARHAHRRNIPPPKPMTIQEAQHLIKELLTKWIESKSDSL